MKTCLLFGHDSQLTSKKIAAFLLGTRETLGVFKMYELRYLWLKVYPLIHNLFHNPRYPQPLFEQKDVNDKFKMYQCGPAPWSVLWILKTICDFFMLWPWYQWVFSLLGLIYLYWITGIFYNERLSKQGGWLEWSTRIWLIVADLSINFALGLYYMHHRETFMGALMMKCPIAISPVIFFLELTCFYVYHRYDLQSWWKSRSKSRK